MPSMVFCCFFLLCRGFFFDVAPLVDLYELCGNFKYSSGICLLRRRDGECYASVFSTLISLMMRVLLSPFYSEEHETGAITQQLV